jgi:RNA polymerase-binding transcription factor DksA
MPQHEAARVQLEDQLAHLLARVGKIERDLRQPPNPDWPERATERENDEVLQGLDDMTLGEVRRIRAALARIANGTYGTCATCGHPVSKERLAAIPSAVTCLACSGGRAGKA